MLCCIGGGRLRIAPPISSASASFGGPKTLVSANIVCRIVAAALMDVHRYGQATKRHLIAHEEDIARTEPNVSL